MSSTEAWDAAVTFNAVFSVIAFLTIVWTVYFFWRHASHPMVVIRYPKVMIFDLLASLINCIIQCFVSTAMFGFPVPCQPMLSVSDAFDCFSNSVLIGRAVLFYMQARAMNHIAKNPLMDKLMDGIALFTAPGEYFRLRRQVKAAEMETIKGGSQSNSTSSPTWTERNGFVRFLGVQLLWLLFGVSYSYGATVANMGSQVFVYDPVIGNPLFCWAAFVTWYSTAVYVLTVLCSVAILIAVYPVRDLVGLRNDLVWSLGIGVFFKLLNLLANIMFNFDPNWAMVSAYSYTLAAFISPAISLTIAGYYVFRTLREDRFAFTKRNRNASHLSQRSTHNSSHNSSETSFVNFNQFCQFWISQEGKQIVGKIAAKLYMLESVRFLHDTDDQEQIVSNFERMYKEYIVNGAKWELNIPGAMKLNCQSANATKDEQKIREAVLEVRKEILQMLFPLIRHELTKEERDASVQVEAQKVLSPRSTSAASGLEVALA
jgi:hypothetical protein